MDNIRFITDSTSRMVVKAIPIKFNVFQWVEVKFDSESDIGERERTRIMDIFLAYVDMVFGFDNDVIMDCVLSDMRSYLQSNYCAMKQTQERSDTHVVIKSKKTAKIYVFFKVKDERSFKFLTEVFTSMYVGLLSLSQEKLREVLKHLKEYVKFKTNIMNFDLAMQDINT